MSAKYSVDILITDELLIEHTHKQLVFSACYILRFLKVIRLPPKEILAEITGVAFGG